jgi:hypothetical protein
MAVSGKLLLDLLSISWRLQHWIGIRLAKLASIRLLIMKMRMSCQRFLFQNDFRYRSFEHLKKPESSFISFFVSKQACLVTFWPWLRRGIALIETFQNQSLFSFYLQTI